MSISHSQRVTLEKEILFEQENIKAENFLEANDLSSAARILVNIVEKDPENWRAFNNMGIICWAQREWEDAFTMFKKSVQLYPEYIDGYMNLFDSALKLHKIAEVTELFRNGASLNPESEELQILMESIDSQGDGIYQSQRALMIGHYNPIVQEAQILLEKGQYFDATEKFLEVLNTIGPNADAYCGLGIVSFHQQRFHDAFVLFFQALQLNPLDVDLHLNLLDAAKRCDCVQKAKDIFEIYRKEFKLLDSIRNEFDNCT